MHQPAAGDVTQLLRAWGQGDEQSLEKLIPVVYDQPRRMAARYMRNGNPRHTLQATAPNRWTQIRGRYHTARGGEHVS